MNQITFSVAELIAVLGVAQCVYVIVAILFRAGRLSHAALPLLYFFTLGVAFLLDFGFSHLGQSLFYYPLLHWVAWFSVLPLSVLLIRQIADILSVPKPRFYAILFVLPIALFVAYAISQNSGECLGRLLECKSFYEFLDVTGLFAGCVSLLVIWFSRSIMKDIHQQKGGKDRYWLILALIFANIGFLALVLLNAGAVYSQETIMISRNIVGLVFVYLVITSLFRIYPQAVNISVDPSKQKLNPEELNIACRIEDLMRMDKLYHEPAYSRADLAKELNVSEAILSRIINIHFKQSFPQLLNDHRVQDAKRLLKQTEAPVKIIAEEVGFNSLASFNRVFRDIEGSSPSDFRKKSTQ